MSRKLTKIQKLTSAVDPVILLLATILVGVSILAAWLPLHGDTFFHTDIARDFLVLEDIVATRKPTLIGPKAGGISGLFHGPLWFYVSLPAFILFNGEPALMGWWWIVLFMIHAFSGYWIGKQLGSKQTGLLAAVLTVSFSITKSTNVFNPYGAVLVSLWFLYFWFTYTETALVRYLAVAVLLLGVLIQFQMAFGAPMVVLAILALVYRCTKHRKWLHMGVMGLLLIPLATFLLFDVRHDWLQIKAVMAFVRDSDPVETLSWIGILKDRLHGALIQSVSVLPGLFGNHLFEKLGPVIVWVILGLGWRSARDKVRSWFGWGLYFFAGYWGLSLFFPGTIWGYYYWPFLPWVALFLAQSVTATKGKLTKGLISLVLAVLMIDGLITAQAAGEFVGTSDLSWKFYGSMANTIFAEAPDEFGYYIYTPDLYGYQARYGMNYQKRFYPDKLADPYVKHDVTYLIFAPAPEDKPYLNGDDWKWNDVKIASDPVSVTAYPNGYRVEEYRLTEEEIAIPSNPLMIRGLSFR